MTMLFTNNVDKKNTQHPSLCIQHSNNPSKPTLSRSQSSTSSDDDESTSSLVDTQPLGVLFAVIPDQHQTSTSSSSTADESLPKVALTLKPKARRPSLISELPSSADTQCIQQPEGCGSEILPQPELSLPSLPMGVGEDDGDVPDLVSEGDRDDCIGKDDISDGSPKRSWPANTQPAGLKSSLKKSTNGLLINRSSPSNVTIPRSTVLSSALRKKRPTTQRRVRGLWSVDAKAAAASSTRIHDDRFEELRDETLECIFSFLDLADTCRAGMVGRRWKSIIQNAASLWKRIDASSFAQQAYQTFGHNPDRTGQALEGLLKRHKPETLVIRNIGRSLSADTYLPSISTLKELTITNFKNLTDTHMHVMMLMTLKKKQSNGLQVMHLEDCPLLTTASIRSITSTCTKLTRLSLKGNAKMTDVSPLAPLWATKEAPMLAFPGSSAGGPPAPSLASFSALFAPPPTPPRPPMTPPPRPSTPTEATSTANTTATTMQSAGSLQSLFAPPGMSPPRKSSSSLSASSSLALPSIPGSSQPVDGKLQHVDIRGTNITAQSVLQGFKKTKVDSGTSSTSPVMVDLRSLAMDGDTWTDALLTDLSQLIALEELQELALGVSANKSGGGGMLTNKGLKSMARNATPRFSNLIALDLSGQTGITGLGLASLVSHSASPNLQTIKIENCHGISTDTKGMDRLVKALAKSKNSSNTHVPTSLHMRGCFMSCTSSSCHPASSQMKELDCWERFMDGIPEMSLRYLDVRDCWTAATTYPSVGATANRDNDNDGSGSSREGEGNDDNTLSTQDEIDSVRILRSTIPNVLF